MTKFATEAWLLLSLVANKMKSENPDRVAAEFIKLCHIPDPQLEEESDAMTDLTSLSSTSPTNASPAHHAGSVSGECPVCHQFSTATYIHLLEKHVDKKNSTICPVCHTQVVNPQVIRWHLLTHFNVRPYLCMGCNASFRVVSLFKEHTLHP